MFTLVELLLDWLYPRKCLFCTEIIPAGERKFCCGHCAYEAFLIEPPRCSKCGAPCQESICDECSIHVHSFTQNLSLFIYDDIVRDMILRFKYSGKANYAPTVAALMHRGFSLPAEKIGCIDCIVPVPLHISRKRRRGYNQAALLAKELGKLYGKPMNEPLLRSKKTKPQSGLNALERKNNVENAFRLKPDYSCAGKTFLLIDDIYTTGSTLDSCANVLKTAGAANVFCMTIAKIALNHRDD